MLSALNSFSMYIFIEFMSPCQVFFENAWDKILVYEIIPTLSQSNFYVYEGNF